MQILTLIQIYVFVLAGFVGFLVITRVPPLLHTPLMSATNAISVPMMAAAMPPTPAATPRRAVRGWFSHRSERMKRTAAMK